jgi:hypothetical protein
LGFLLDIKSFTNWNPKVGKSNLGNRCIILIHYGVKVSKRLPKQPISLNK